MANNSGEWWTGGMTPRSRQLQKEHDLRLEELLKKAIMEEEAKRAAKALKVAEKAAARSARGAEGTAGRTSWKTSMRGVEMASGLTSPSSIRSKRRFFKRRSLRALKPHDDSDISNDNSLDNASRRASVKYVRSESPCSSVRSTSLRGRILRFAGRKMEKGMPRISSASWLPSATMTRISDNSNTPQLSESTGVDNSSSSRDDKKLESGGADMGRQVFMAAIGNIPALKEVLSNKSKEPFDLQSFLRFAEDHWFDENILFYLEVEAFKSASGGEQEYLTCVKRIHDMYIAPTAPREVNISGGIHVKTSAAVNSILRGKGKAISNKDRNPPPNSDGTTRDSQNEKARHECQPERPAKYRAEEVRDVATPDASSRDRYWSVELSPIILPSPPLPLGPELVNGKDNGICTAGHIDQNSKLRESLPPAPHVLPGSFGDQDTRGLHRRFLSLDLGNCDSGEISLNDSGDESVDFPSGVNRTCLSTTALAELVEVGPGGGFGDRTIFNVAQQEIFELLEKDAYRRFARIHLGSSSSRSSIADDC